MQASLFDQLHNKLDIQSSAPSRPVQRTSTQDITSMQFTHSLIKHLDALYSKMLAGEISDINDESIMEIPPVQTRAYYNPGHSSVTESA